MSIRLPKNPPLVHVPVSQVLWRVHRAKLKPLWFGPAAGGRPEGRFDAAGGAFGICYFGESLGVSILETLVRANKVRVISRDELQLRAASTVALKVPLQMLRLEGEGLASFGVSANVVHGNDYRACRDLALRVHEKLDEVDGIQYRSRWDTSKLCWALFDRGQAKLGGVLGTQRLDDPAVVLPALRPYGSIMVFPDFT